MRATRSLYLRRHGVLVATVATLLVALAATGWLLRRTENPVRRTRLNPARQAYEAGKFSESAEALKEIVADEPENWEARRVLALALAAQGDNAGALAQYRAIVASNPGDHAAFYRLAALERILGKPKDSESHLRKALELDPNNDSYVDELARTELALGQPEAAAMLWGRVLHKPGASKESRKGLLVLQAQAYEQARDDSGAIDAYRKALQLDPSDKILQARVRSFQ